MEIVMNLRIIIAEVMSVESLILLLSIRMKTRRLLVVINVIINNKK